MEVLEQRHDLEQVRALLDADLHDDSTGAAEVSGVVLRGAGATNVGEFRKRPQIHVRGTFECSSNTERISLPISMWWSQRDLNPCLSLERAPS
jgi:hypothetical protein